MVCPSKGRRLLLYPHSGGLPACKTHSPGLWASDKAIHQNVAKVAGIEPATRGFGDRRSTIELHRHLVAQSGIEPETLGYEPIVIPFHHRVTSEAAQTAPALITQPAQFPDEAEYHRLQLRQRK